MFRPRIWPSSGRYKQEYKYSWFQTFAVFWFLYVFFCVIPRRLNFICRRFGTFRLFHLHRQVGMKNKIQTPGNYPEESIHEYKYNYETARTLRTDTFVIAYLFMSPWIWPHMWPKHAEGHSVMKLHQNTIVHFFVLLSYSLINAPNMNHAR
jgi:hypothetical protein